MTLNRMGPARRMSNRKAWLSATLALGALAASGGVAMAAHNEEPERKIKDVSQSLQVKHSDNEDAEKSAKRETEKAAKGQVCLKLDKKAQKLITEAGVAAKGGTVTVPLNKVKVVRCKSTSKPAPAPKPPAPKPPKPGPAPQPTSVAPAPKPPAPKPQPPAPRPPAPKPIVTSTAS